MVLGEQPLLPYEACNLGSINLKNHVCMDCSGIGMNDRDVDWDKLRETIRTAVHFLDNVIDVNNYPIPEIDRMTRATRKIGLGVMGFADMLLLLGIPYNSQEAIVLAKRIMKVIHDVGHEESIKLADQRGPYPAYSKLESCNPENMPPIMRNATVTTIAPTGSISIIAGVSSGIEPIFAYAYYRNVMDNDKLVEANPILISALKERGVYTPEIMDKIIEHGSLQHIEEIPADIRRVFVCAHDITPDDHITMQAAFQKYTDNAVSKTVNFPNSATREDVAEVYIKAYKTGCKGTTIYRDGSRDNQVLNLGKVKEDQPEQPKFFSDLPKDVQDRYLEQIAEGQPHAVEESFATLTASVKPRDRSEQLEGITRRIPIGCGKLYVTVNHDEHGICEIFTSNGKGGGCPSQSEGTARLASIALRAGISVEDICKQLRGIRCPSCQRNSAVKVLSCPDAIGRVLEEANKRFKAEQEGITKIEGVQPEETLDAVNHSINRASLDVMVDIAKEKSDEEVLTYLNGNKATLEPVDLSSSDLKFAKYCPECGELLEHEGGCVMCRNCGWSKCG